MHSSMVTFYCVVDVCGTHSFWSFSRIYSAFFGGHKHLSQTPLHVESLQMLWHRTIICMCAKCIQVWWLFIVLRLFAKPTHSGHFRGFIVHFWWSQTSLANAFARWIITNALTQNHNMYVCWMHSSMVVFYCVAAVCGTHSFWLFSRIYSAFFGGHKHLSQTPLHVESLQMLWHRIIIFMYACWMHSSMVAFYSVAAVMLKNWL